MSTFVDGERERDGPGEREVRQHLSTVSVIEVGFYSYITL